MKDFAGNELEMGDRVIVMTTGLNFNWARITGLTPKMVRLKFIQDNGFEYDTTRWPHHVILPLTPDTLYAIQMESQSSASWGWRDHFKDPAC